MQRWPQSFKGDQHSKGRTYGMECAQWDYNKLSCFWEDRSGFEIQPLLTGEGHDRLEARGSVEAKC